MQTVISKRGVEHKSNFIVARDSIASPGLSEGSTNCGYWIYSYDRPVVRRCQRCFTELRELEFRDD